MIQRIQTIFYLLAALAFGGLFKFAFASSSESIPQYLADQTYNVHDHIAILILVILGLISALAAIFLFKNRSLQLKTGYAVVAMSVLIPAVAFLVLYLEKSVLETEVEVSPGIGLYLPIGALLFGILGNRFVKKDDKLVKSMDRLR